MSNYRLTIGKGNVLRYRYTAGGCMDFDFHLLCEVGEPYQQWFKDEIKRRGIRVRTKELAQHPWYADVALRDDEDEDNLIGGVVHDRPAKVRVW